MFTGAIDGAGWAGALADSGQPRDGSCEIPLTDSGQSPELVQREIELPRQRIEPRVGDATELLSYFGDRQKPLVFVHISMLIVQKSPGENKPRQREPIRYVSA
jgi:hypothetical protein